MTVSRVDPAAAAQLLQDEGFVYVDVRSEQEFLQGHAAGAYNIPWQHIGPTGMQDNADFVRTVRAHFDPNAKLVIGCKSGHRSLSAARRLQGAGYCNLVELQTGYDGVKDPFGRTAQVGWKDSGLPCSTEPLPGRDFGALSGSEPSRP